MTQLCAVSVLAWHQLLQPIALASLTGVSLFTRVSPESHFFILLRRIRYCYKWLYDSVAAVVSDLVGLPMDRVLRLLINWSLVRVRVGEPNFKNRINDLREPATRRAFSFLMKVTYKSPLQFANYS